MKVTKGTRLLAELVAPKKHTQASIARKLAVTPEAVRHWLNGATKPKAEYRKKLEKLTGIPASSWDEPEGAAADDEEPEAA